MLYLTNIKNCGQAQIYENEIPMGRVKAGRLGRRTGYPYDYMPRTPTPVVSPSLAIAQCGLLPSVITRTSAFTFSCLKSILRTTITKISGLNLAACNLAPSGSGLPLPGLPADFTTGLVANLWPGGTSPLLRSHPLGNNIEFHSAFSRIPDNLGFLGAM